MGYLQKYTMKLAEIAMRHSDYAGLYHSEKIFCMSKLLWVQTDFKTFFLRINAAYRSFLLPTTAHLVEITSTYSNCVFIIRQLRFFFLSSRAVRLQIKRKTPIAMDALSAWS